MKKAKRFVVFLFSFLFPLFCLIGIEPNTSIRAGMVKRANDEAFALRIGMEANYSPFNYTETENDPDNNVPIQGQSGQYAAGYDVSVAKFIAEDNNWNLEIVRLEWDALIPSVNSGTINAIIAGMSDTEERRQSIDFTDPYYTSELVIIARANDDDFQDNFNPTNATDKSFVTQAGTVEDDIAISWASEYGIQRNNPTTDYPSAFEMVVNHLADAVICEYPVATAMMASYPTLKMVTVDTSSVSSTFIQQLSVSIGIAKGDPDNIIDSINASLAKLDEDDRRQYMDAAIERSQTNSEVEESGENRILYLLRTYGIDFAYGTLTTLILAVVGTLVGLIIGIFVGQVRNLKIRREDSLIIKGVKATGKFLAYIYETFFRGTPMMIQAMILFLLGPAIGITWTDMSLAGDIGRIFNGYMLCGLIVICINTGAYMTEIVKSGMNGVDKGQEEAARSLGLSKTRTLFGVTLPQALKNCLPTIGNEFIVNIKDSSVLNVIGLTELYMTASIATNTNYFTIEGYIIICVIYLLLVLVSSFILKLIENKMNINSEFNIFGFRRRPKKSLSLLTAGLKEEKADE